MKFYDTNSNSSEEYNALNFLRKYIGILGTSSIIGSGTKYKSFYNGHDLDIAIITNLKSRPFIKGICINAIENWIKIIDYLPLHFIVIGNFNSEYYYIKIDNKEHIIQFVNKKTRYILWAETNFLKFLRLNSKKSLIMKKVYSLTILLLLRLKRNF